MKEKITAGKIWRIISPLVLDIGITVIVSNLIAVIVTVMVTMSSDISNPNIIAEKVQKALYSQSMLVTMCVALAVLPFAITMRYKDIQREKLNDRLKRYERVFFLKYFLIIPFGFFCMLAANYFVSILTVMMPNFMTESYKDTANIIYGSGIEVQIITAAIVGPIAEEMIFRALVYNRVKKIIAIMPAAIISSLLFGIYHGNWIQAPYAFLIGMVCVYVYEKYKSIAAPIILHMSANLLSVIISSMATTVETGQDVVSVSVMQQVSACAIITVIAGALAYGVSVVINKTVNPKEITD